MAKPDLSKIYGDVDIYGRVLSLPQLQNRGTRILTSRFGTRSNGPGKTFHVTMALAQHFDAVRLILANTSTSLSISTYLAKVAVSSSIATDVDINNSAGAWQTVTMEGNTALSVPNCDEVDVPEYSFTDWTSLQSINRTDAGTLPLLTIRLRAVSLASVICYGDGIDDFTNWSAHPSGRVWFAREQDGDHLTVTTGFNSTVNVSQSPIIGIQYISRGKVVTWMGDGDSITDGRGTYLGEGFIMPACVRQSDMNKIAVEYANLGWSGQTYQKFHKRGLNALLTELAPDVLVIPAGSPNDIAGAITATHIANFSLQRSVLVEQCFDVGVKPVVWTMLPSNTAVKNYGATDALRVAYNTVVLALAQHDLNVLDTASLVSGATVGGQVQMTGTTDGIHPNQAGNALLSQLFDSVVIKLSQYPSRRNSKRHLGKPWPVFAVTGGSITMSRQGFYVFAGGSAATASFPTLVPQIYKREPLVVHLANRGSANITVSGTVQFAMNSVFQTGLTLYPGASCMLVFDGNNITVFYPDFPSTIQHFTPLTGTNVAPVNNRGQLLTVRLAPAGTLATLTVTFPPSPANGQEFCIVSTQIITAMTFGGNGATISDPLISMSANQSVRYQYSLTGNTWYKV